MSTDAILQARIHDALAAALGDRAATVGVAVDRGVVILTGSVGTFHDKLAAAKCAAAVARAAANRIEVRDPAFHRRDDAEVARDCAAALAADPGVPRAAVHVTVEGGYVHLTGAVEDPRDAAAATRAVTRVPGVVGVWSCGPSTTRAGRPGAGARDRRGTTTAPSGVGDRPTAPAYGAARR